MHTIKTQVLTLGRCQLVSQRHENPAVLYLNMDLQAIWRLVACAIGTGQSIWSRVYRKRTTAYVVHSRESICCTRYQAADGFPFSTYANVLCCPAFFSKEMTSNCSAYLAEQGFLPGFIDIGTIGEEVHTAFSKDPEAAAAIAFTDFLHLMDADIIVRSASSFSGTVVAIKGMNCREALPGVALPVTGLFVCSSQGC